VVGDKGRLASLTGWHPPEGGLALLLYLFVIIFLPIFDFSSVS
jgi:hypothetical protein